MGFGFLWFYGCRINGALQADFPVLRGLSCRVPPQVGSLYLGSRIQCFWGFCCTFETQSPKTLRFNPTKIPNLRINTEAPTP